MDMYDSDRPWLVPASAAVLAFYGTGLYAADRATVQREHPHTSLLAIDAVNTDPGGCSIADVERFDMKPSDLLDWVPRRLRAHPGSLARVYCDKSTWPEAQYYVGQLAEAERGAVRWWIADPTGTAHQLDGADAVQWFWGQDWDISTVEQRFLS